MILFPGPLIRVASTLGINFLLTRALLTRGKFLQTREQQLQVLTASNALVGGTGTAVAMASGWGDRGLQKLAVGVGTYGYLLGCGLAEIWEIAIQYLF